MSLQIVCQNKKARHDYFIEETFEAGIELVGCEVKSLRAGRANLTDSYARVHNGEIYLLGLHVSPYAQGDAFTAPEPLRKRRLLLHKREIIKLIGKTRERGYTLVVTRIYFKGGKAKAELGLARGKKLHDKRETIKQKTVERELGRTFKGAKIKT